MSNLKIINMQDVEIEEVRWLWYPYIPLGKICILQGDGGDGKTTMALNVAAAITRGELLPESKCAVGPFNVIFQTAEDGLGDTIKPRLLQAGADASKVHVIDEDLQSLTLSDVRIAEAIAITGAKLFIIDPIQAYIGAKVDMHRANEIRPVLKRISDVAEKSGCSFLLIGHLNKSNNKSQYRGLGSIDIHAAARSILTFGRIKDEPYLRAFAHTKSNLAPEGPAISYEIHPDTGFRWVGKCSVTIAELLCSSEGVGTEPRESAFSRAVSLIQTELASGSLPADALYQRAKEQNISERTLNSAKASLKITSTKQGKQWFWSLD